MIDNLLPPMLVMASRLTRTSTKTRGRVVTDRIRVLASIVIVSSIFMIAVFAAASGRLPADTNAVLGQMSICRSP